MSERPEPYGEPYGERYREPEDWREQTTPGMTPAPPRPIGDTTQAYPAAGGYPGGGYGGDRYAGGGYGGGYAGGPSGSQPYEGGVGTATSPDYAGYPVAVRRPDAGAALLLVLAGIAAAVSLLLHWVHGSSLTGWGLIRLAKTQLQTSLGEIFRTGVWQPVAVVAGGALLFVLGLLLFIPARTHRFLGVLALLVSIGAGAGVLVALSGAGWHVGRFDIGFWCAVAVPVLGLLGALKALLTGARRTAP